MTCRRDFSIYLKFIESLRKNVASEKRVTILRIAVIEILCCLCDIRMSHRRRRCCSRCHAVFGGKDDVLFCYAM